jgi:hypothetical protein
MYQGYANNHWEVVRKNPILSTLYDPLIAKGEHLADKWGTIGAYWNSAM